jgi:HlyD family secretion protein
MVTTTDTPAGLAVGRRPKGWSQRRVILGLLLLALVVVAALWLVVGRSARSTSYATATVDRGTVARTVSATGTINPILTVTVGSYVSGVIQDVLCDYNTKVTKGQVCARIDARPFQSTVDQAQAALDIAKAQLQKDNASLNYAKASFQRNSTLLSTNAVSQDAVDNARSVYEQAQASIAYDQATIEQRQAELSAAQINLAYTNILSPVDGTVVSRNVTAGQTVASSLQTPTLFLIAQDLTSMEVDTNVSESDIGAVKAGEKATFTVDAYPGRTFQGVIGSVRQAPQTVQNVVTYDVIVNVNNPDLALMPGMTATTAIIIDSRDDVLRVPSQALRYRPANARQAGARPQRAEGSTASPRSGAGNGQSAHGASNGAQTGATGPAAATTHGAVFVLRDGKPVYVPVQVGLDDGKFAEIAGGDLKPGDQVIIGEMDASAARAQAGHPQGAPRLRL